MGELEELRRKPVPHGGRNYGVSLSSRARKVETVEKFRPVVV